MISGLNIKSENIALLTECLSCGLINIYKYIAPRERKHTGVITLLGVKIFIDIK